MATGDTLLILHPYHNEPPTANYATFDIRNQHPVLDFDDATDESALFTAILPRAYAGNGLTVTLHVAATSDTTTSHESYWDVSFERVTAQDLDADSFAAAQSGHIHPDATAGIPSTVSLSFTHGAQIDSLAAGELFRLKVTRDADNASDNWTGDAELVMIEIKES